MTTHYGTWRKARLSEANGACLEVARSDHGTIGVRDSKQHGVGPVLDFTRSEWVAFLKTIRSTRA
ncbi:DUF397 domain-containing protein [Actinomadura monticuli]|uniref:DUF397 domain-containing protein n=1 Tax=Actinomadura monticuli TaxID=3097367 RepID=A0ABV4QG59_9ACTN